MNNYAPQDAVADKTLDAAIRAYSEAAKGFQAIALEAADYSRRSLAHAMTHLEALRHTSEPQAQYALQAKFNMDACTGFMSEAAKIAGLCDDMTRMVNAKFKAS